jgi:predicted nucleic acid-binding Zn ribbon protein
MPVYQYYEIFPDGSEGEPFDVSQKINEPTLKVHPITGNPVKKLFSAPSINTQYSDAATNIKRMRRLESITKVLALIQEHLNKLTLKNYNGLKITTVSDI